MTLPIFFINLDRVPDRAQFMQAQFDGLGLTATRLRAVDAHDMDRPAGYDPGQRRHNRWALTQSEIACFESHRAAWARIAQSGPQGGVVCEDDAFLSKAFSNFSATFQPDAFDGHLIKLDGVNQITRFAAPVAQAGVQLRTIRSAMGSAAAYYMTQEAAEQAIARSARYCDHLDDFLFTPQPGWHIFQLEPAVAVQGMFLDAQGQDRDSGDTTMTSERTQDGAINARASKGPLGFRLTKEARRSLRRLAAQLGGDRALVKSGGAIMRPPLAPDLGSYKPL